MAKILITGHMGSLGSELYSRLTKDGEHYVVGLDMKTGHDLTHEETMWRFVPYDFEYVIHCAATIYGVEGFNKNSFEILRDDLKMTMNAIEIAKRSKKFKKFIFMSSSMVYEKIISGMEGVSELLTDYNVPPSTGYGLSKFVGEKLVKEFCKDNECSYTIWRPFNIITPYERARQKQGYAHVFADFLKFIITDGRNPMPILGDGEQIRCFTWIDEVADAIVDNLENSKTDNHTFNLGNQEPIKMFRLAEKIYAEAIEQGVVEDTGELQFEHMPVSKNDVRLRIPNSNKAKMFLGWEAKVKIDEALKYCVEEWSRENAN